MSKTANPLPPSLRPDQILDTWQSDNYMPFVKWAARLNVLYAEQGVTFEKLADSLGHALRDGGIKGDAKRMTTLVSEMIQGGIAARGILDRLAQEKIGGQPYNPAHFNVVPVEQPIELYGDAMVINDVQLPCADYPLCQMVSAIGRKHLTGPRQLVINGDFLNVDAFSRFAPVTLPPTLMMEMDAAAQLVTEWLETFQSIVWNMGNHERRFMMAVRAQLGAGELLAILKERMGKAGEGAPITVTNLDRVHLNTNNGEWVIVHGANYARNQLANPSRIANRFQRNIIMGHEHHFGVGFDEFKHYVIVSNGGLFDTQKMHYINEVTTNHPNMMPGFTLIKNGRPYLFGNEQMTDYSYWL